MNHNVTYDAVVVLAGFTPYKWYIKNSYTENKDIDYFLFTEDVDRILWGIEFVKSGHAHMLLFGDWRIEPFSEADIVFKFAIQQGLKPEQIKIYGKIKRTVDEAKNVKIYVDKHSVGKLLLITSESHMRRALAMFNKQGLVPDTYSVNKNDNQVSLRYFIPSALGVVKSKSCLYELVGYLGYYIKGEL